MNNHPRPIAAWLAVVAAAGFLLVACGSPRHVGAEGTPASPSRIASADSPAGVRDADPAEFQIAFISVPPPRQDVCPVRLTFRVKISVTRGPVVVDYAWLVDGAPAPKPGRLTFPGRGQQSKTVELTVERSEPGKVSTALALVWPQRLTSAYRYVLVECGSSR